MENMRGGVVIKILWRTLSNLLLSLVVTIPILASSSINSPEDNVDLEKYSDITQKTANSKKTAYVPVPQIKKEEMDRIYHRLRDQLTKKIDFWQIILLDDQHLRLLRNEIFARHGYKFQTEDLQNYFSSFSWYKPKDAFTEASFSAIERENVSMIKRLESLRRADPAKAVEKPNFQKISEQEPSRVKPFENQFFKHEDSKVIFKHAKKTRVLEKAEGPDGRLYRYETASVFNDMPLLMNP